MESFSGTWDQGGPGGAGPPLELRFYRVKIFKIGKISFFLLFGPPLGKNRSQGPVNEGQTFCSKIHGHIIEFDENSPAKFKMKLKAVIEEFFSSEQNSSSQITSFFVGLLKRNIVGGPKNLQIWSWSHTGNIFNLPAAILAHQDLNFSNSSYVCEQPWNLDCVKISTTEMSSSSMQPKLCDENCFKEQTIICEKG